ncbi:MULTISPECIES: YggT family protein [Gammaproteobacteria]|uniref:YggT family protein n=1 Tax=Gammaproteobacteria TaxID=1236 RepID=UPI000DCFB688|nr:MULTISPECIES: YggT family protein [Gammaproteobacteria]RTE87711.1 YggT family protein [Aliidiomarina sp. B3213]TCZ92506.1 YggT family protein [Lysobacter sp. N42]
MNNAFEFLISTAFSLYTAALILRVWMQLVQANYFSPVAEMIRKVTNPVVQPLRKVIPNAGKIDIAGILLTVGFTVLHYFVIMQIRGVSAPALDLVLFSLQQLLLQVLSLMFWILIVRAIMSWFSNGSNPLEYVLMELTEPMLRPIRRVLPPMGGLDLSVLILIVAIQFFRIALQ